MNWNNQWSPPANPVTEAPLNPKPSNPWDVWTQDQCLMHWQSLKEQLTKAKEDEMDFRKYVVSRAFPNPKEGMNTLELGGGYELKAGVKFNYKLADNDTVENCIDRIANIGNDGAFIAPRLVSWTPSFLLTEYRNVQAAAESGLENAKEILKIINEMLIIEDAAPSLDIKEPKKGKGK